MRPSTVRVCCQTYALGPPCINKLPINCRRPIVAATVVHFVICLTIAITAVDVVDEKFVIRTISRAILIDWYSRYAGARKIPANAGSGMMIS